MHPQGLAAAASMPVLDGLFLAIVGRTDGRVTLAADRLGFFPVFWWRQGEVFLAASSPGAFRAHPCFSVRLSKEGLAALLLTNLPSTEQTLLEGVRRLKAGAILSRHRDGEVEETQWYLPPLGEQYYSLPLDYQVEVADDALSSFLQRQAADDPIGFLLSGGRDSRVLSGYLAPRGPRVHALTFGVPSDLDYRLARRVAGVSGFRHITQDRAQSAEAADSLLTSIAQDHLSRGSGSVGSGATRRGLDLLPPRTVTGYALDYVLAGWSGFATAPKDDTWPDWPSVFLNLNRWGLSEDTVRRLIRRESLGNGIEAAKAALEAEFTSLGSPGAGRMWRFMMRKRGRMLVGAAAWRMSRTTWPVLPALGGEVLRTMGNMPYNCLAERVLERAIIKAKFPVLATIPAAGNSGEAELIRPRVLEQIRLGLSARWRALPLLGRREQRYFVRTNDFNGPRWLELRAEADRRRKRAEWLFDPAVLEELLPRAGVVVPVNRDPWAAPARMQLLVGLVTWASEFGG